MALTDRQVQNKLNQLARLASELDTEARRRWGTEHPEAALFFEADGSFYMMAGDCGGPVTERQKFIRFTSATYCRMGAGAW